MCGKSISDVAGFTTNELERRSRFEMKVLPGSKQRRMMMSCIAINSNQTLICSFRVLENVDHFYSGKLIT